MTELGYCKRYRMELSLRGWLASPPVLPEEFYLIPWDDGLVLRHAETKFEAFHNEYDSAIFPSLRTHQGCVQLMGTIRTMRGFVPGATWLVANGIDTCGTVQGVRDGFGGGAIQNLGVTPTYRGRGLALALMIQALRGFQSAGLAKAVLEVTADNTPAVRLYQSLGFRCRRVVYKPIQVATSAVSV